MKQTSPTEDQRVMVVNSVPESHIPEQQGCAMLDGGWLTTDELASSLGLDSSTLRRWRTMHPLQGPPFVRLSAHVTLYSSGDVERWLASRRIDPSAAA